MLIVILSLLFGMLLIVAGRNLFWLCVGIIGFLAGVQFSTSLGITHEGIALMAAIALGLLGIILAICFEWVAVVVGIGFMGGGYLLMNFFLPTVGQWNAWPIYIIGGILGMCLMILTFDLTLIFISSLIGSMLIVNAYQGTEEAKGILLFACMITGVLVQWWALKGLQSQDPRALSEQNK